MSERVNDLVRRSGDLFSRKRVLDTLWQEIAENFYPERADFTVTRFLGQDFANNLSTSYPLLARRELGDTFSTMLRPTKTDWFHVRVKDREDYSIEEKRWLEMATTKQRKFMYEKESGFVRATKEGDHDFAAFGQCVISTEYNKDFNGLLYRCHHLRDVAWSEDHDGMIDFVCRKWKPTVRNLCRQFPDKVCDKIKQNNEKDPFRDVVCQHIVMRADEYQGLDGNGMDFKDNYEFVSIYIDVENMCILEEKGVHDLIYTIPRWQTVSGSQYAYSPATVAGLADARLIQAITLTLLEAGEKAVNPAMIATDGSVRSDVNLMAGGVTWVDQEYDERLGQSLRPVAQDFSGLPTGMDMQERIRMTIMEAFFLNKINLPPAQSPEMTAFEFSQRIQEYIRQAMPLFEPMEINYNGEICTQTFKKLFRGGAFGSIDEMPESLREADIDFVFESPLHDAKEKQKSQVFMQTKALLAEAVALDEGAASIIDARGALRDALDGMGTPAKWMKSDEQVQKEMEARKQAIAQQQQLAMMQQGAEVAEKMGNAGQSMAEAQRKSGMI